MPPWLVAEGPAAYYCWGMQRMQATTAARAVTFLAALAALSSLCLVSATAWADPAGIIKTLSGPVSVVRGGATMPATVGMALEASLQDAWPGDDTLSEWLRLLEQKRTTLNAQSRAGELQNLVRTIATEAKTMQNMKVARGK